LYSSWIILPYTVQRRETTFDTTDRKMRDGSRVMRKGSRTSEQNSRSRRRGGWMKIKATSVVMMVNMIDEQRQSDAATATWSLRAIQWQMEIMLMLHRWMYVYAKTARVNGV